jgi:single-strand DNA-binding protein
MKEDVVMVDLNRVMLIGRLTADPEQRKFDSGAAVTNFTVAVNRKWKDAQTSVVREEATFVDVDAWGKSGELVKKYFTKGRSIFIEGRLRLDRWETKSGEKRSRMKVVVDRFSFVPDGKFTGKAASDGHDGGEALPVPVSAPVVVAPVAVGAAVGADDHVVRTPRLVPDPLDGPADRFDTESHDDEMPF